jgi:glycosyltransferase involved in cell wall biosynthesis
MTIRRVPCVRRKELHCSAPEAATYVAFALPVVRRLIRRYRPDLVHAHFIFPDGFIAWLVTRGLGIPYLITAHGTDVPGYNPHRVRTTHRLLSPLWKKVTEGAAAIVCPSELLKGMMQKRGVQARLFVIPNGIDPARFKDRAKQKRILVVTRIVKRKGIQFFLEAIQGAGFDYEVHIVGDGNYLPKLKEIARGARVPIKFWGRLANDSRELTELYETSSIYVLPSESENFPIVLLEAMAARNAVITSYGTGCQEVVGDTGLLVEPRNPAGIHDALLLLVEDPERCRALGEAARSRVEENFSWDTVARCYSALYEQLCLA